MLPPIRKLSHRKYLRWQSKRGNSFFITSKLESLPSRNSFTVFSKVPTYRCTRNRGQWDETRSLCSRNISLSLRKLTRPHFFPACVFTCSPGSWFYQNTRPCRVAAGLATELDGGTWTTTALAFGRAAEETGFRNALPVPSNALEGFALITNWAERRESRETVIPRVPSKEGDFRGALHN